MNSSIRRPSPRMLVIIIFFLGQAVVLLLFHVNLQETESATATDSASSFLADFIQSSSGSVIRTRNSDAQRQRQVQQKVQAAAAKAVATAQAHSHHSHIDPIEEQEAMKYIRSFDSKTSFARPLNFFHIPKTAGTSVEETGAASRGNFSWGSCAFYHKPKRDICPYPSPSEEWPKHVGWWHLPRQFFPLAHSNPYQNAELFAVIRDPYERMVSEFYYICTLKIKDWRPNQCDRDRLFDASYMNEWLQHKIKGNSTSTTKVIHSEALSYLADNGHFTPQYQFLVGPHNVRVIDHVLRLEGSSSHVGGGSTSSVGTSSGWGFMSSITTTTATSMAEDFKRMVQAYNMPDDLQLQKMNAISAEARNTTQHLQVHDLNDETLRQIHERYPHDLEMLGYASSSSLSSLLSLQG